MSAFDESVFWPAFKAAGFLRPVLVKQSGLAAVAVDVGWREPDTLRFDQTRSKDYEIEYQHEELPRLAEGDAVTLLDDDGIPIPRAKFKVREVPFVSEIEGEGDTGHWRRALLTKL